MTSNFDQKNLQAADYNKTQTAAMPPALQNLASRMKRRVVEPVAGGMVEETFPITAKILQAERELVEKAALAEAEILKNLVIGYETANKGIYFGTWEPVDRDGKSLGKKFNVFAAPTDLDPSDDSGGNCRTYRDAAKEIGNRRNWHGHDGIYLENDTELYKALDDESAIGKWFMPTLELLCGNNVDEEAVREQHLYGLQNVGDLKGTFIDNDQSIGIEPVYPAMYWSCTRHRDNNDASWDVSFEDGSNGWIDDSFVYKLSCRPVRVELVP